MILNFLSPNFVTATIIRFSISQLILNLLPHTVNCGRLCFGAVSLCFFGRPFVKRFALCYRTIVCPVSDVSVLWPNGWMDQDETWCGGRPRSWPQCVKWGPSSNKMGHSSPLPFSSHVLWPNGCTDQDATSHGGRARPRPHCVR